MSRLSTIDIHITTNKHDEKASADLSVPPRLVPVGAAENFSCVLRVVVVAATPPPPPLESSSRVLVTNLDGE